MDTNLDLDLHLGMNMDHAHQLQQYDASSSSVPSLQISVYCKSEKIAAMVSNFDSQKSKLIESIGFGGILKLPRYQTLDPNLCLWLYKIADFHKKCLELAPGVELKFDDPDVNLVFGIPCGSQNIQCNPYPSKDTIDAFIDRISENQMPSPLNLPWLEEILLRDYDAEMTNKEKESFSIAFVMYLCTYLLEPQQKPRFPSYLIQDFLQNRNPADMNWCRFVLSKLENGSRLLTDQLNQGCKQLQLFGCSLFLQIFYLDNLNFGPTSPYHGYLPRASAYTPDVMRYMIGCDYIGLSGNNFIMFGKRKLRNASEVIYTRGWQYYLNIRDDPYDLGPDDYLASIEIMSQGVSLLDKFFSQTSHLTLCQNEYTQPIIATRNSYQAFQSKFNRKNNSTMQKLLMKGGEYIKRHNLTLYKQYIPHVTGVGIDTSNCPISTRPPNFDKLEERSSSSTQRKKSSAVMITAAAEKHKGICTSDTPAFGWQPKIITSHGNFPVSPFHLNLRHNRVDKYMKVRSYNWLSTAPFSTEELSSEWILFTGPQLISIKGHFVLHCLHQDGTFATSFVDAIMKVWSYLDAQMLKNSQKRWRHFLPASFAEAVNNGNDFLNSNVVRSCFLGDHITYDIEDVQQIILPCYTRGESWFCIVWDFKFKTISVLDPMVMERPSGKAKDKHEKNVLLLHNALFACIRYYFRGWDAQSDGWLTMYRTDIDSKRKVHSTGLYTVHYARAFDGNKIAFSLKETNEATLSDARGELLYELMACTENKAMMKRSFARML